MSKLSFNKLTEDLEKLNEDQLEKSEDQKPEDKINEAVQTNQEAELVQPPKDDQAAKAEAEEAEKDKEEEDKEEGAEPEAEAKAEATAEAKVYDGFESEADEDEAVEKAAKAEKDDKADKSKKAKTKEVKGDKEDPDGDKDDQSKARAAEKKKEGDKVKKSEDEFTEKDFVGAFEAVVKSYGSIKANQDTLGGKIESIEKSLSQILTLLAKPEEVSKSEGADKDKEDKEEDKPAEKPLTAEELEKSDKAEEEAPEGKAVEYVSKSDNGVGVPVVEGAEAEDKEEEQFNARDHVSEVTDYYMKSTGMKPGQQAAIRGAVNRVKRGDALDTDISLFKEIVEFNKK